MKRLLLTVLGLLFTTAVFAADFPITATLPAATSVNFIVSQVTPGATPLFESHPSVSLNFDTAGVGMKYLTPANIWAPDKFFAIDLSPVTAGGVQAPGNYGSISFTYGGQVVPAGQPATEGLNKRGTFSAVKVVGATGSQTESTVISARNLGGTLPNLTNADVAGGFLRVYVGGATGELGVGGVPLAPGSVPFTNADKPGVYTGVLTITATML